MVFEYLIAILILLLLLIGLAGPSLVAAYRWRFGGGKLLHDRLNNQSPTRQSQDG